MKFVLLVLILLILAGSGNSQVRDGSDTLVKINNASPISVSCTVNCTSAPNTGTVTSVNDSASNQVLLASNTTRQGSTVFNDSSSTLLLKLGTTATATSYTVKVYSQSYYETPFNYTGIISGIWESDSTGAARITELTP